MVSGALSITRSEKIKLSDPGIDDLPFIKKTYFVWQVSI